MKEALAIDIVCALFGGEQEVRHAYNADQSPHYIQVDCESDVYVMEMGMDKRSSFDSIHQVIFASILTGKKPKIVIIDTDLRRKAEEYQIQLAAEKLGIEYLSIYLGDIPKYLEIPSVRAKLGME